MSLARNCVRLQSRLFEIHDSSYINYLFAPRKEGKTIFFVIFGKDVGSVTECRNAKFDCGTDGPTAPSRKINAEGQTLTRRLPYPTNVSAAE
jgi:hypothetical protein